MDKATQRVRQKAADGADLSDPDLRRDEWGYPAMLGSREKLSPLDEQTLDERTMPGRYDERHEDCC